MVSEDDVAGSVVCGPDPARTSRASGARDAGFDHVYVHQVGPDQDGFFDFYEREVLPATAEMVSRGGSRRKPAPDGGEDLAWAPALVGGPGGQDRLRRPSAVCAGKERRRSPFQELEGPDDRSVAHDVFNPRLYFLFLASVRGTCPAACQRELGLGVDDLISPRRRCS